MEHILVKRNNLDSSNALSTCLIKRSPLLHARHACHQGMRDRDPFANTIRRMNAPRLDATQRTANANTMQEIEHAESSECITWHEILTTPQNKHFTESEKQPAGSFSVSFAADSSHPSTGFIDPVIDPFASFKNRGQASKTVAHAS